MSALIQLKSDCPGYTPEPNVPPAVVEFWRKRGVEVDPYGPPLVNGLPHNLNRVSYRNGRTVGKAIDHRILALTARRRTAGKAIDHKRLALPAKRKRFIFTLPPFPEIDMEEKPRSKRVLERRPIDLAGSERYIDENFGTADRSLLLHQVVRLVGYYHGYSVKKLKSPTRLKRLCYARQQAFWHMYNRTDASYPAIGRFMGDRDHTTVLHGCRVHEARLTELMETA